MEPDAKKLKTDPASNEYTEARSPDELENSDEEWNFHFSDIVFAGPTKRIDLHCRMLIHGGSGTYRGHPLTNRGLWSIFFLFSDNSGLFT